MKSVDRAHHAATVSELRPGDADVIPIAAIQRLIAAAEAVGHAQATMYQRNQQFTERDLVLHYNYLASDLRAALADLPESLKEKP